MTVEQFSAILQISKQKKNYNDFEVKEKIELIKCPTKRFIYRNLYLKVRREK